MNRFLITARIKTKDGDFETKPSPAFFLPDGSFGGEDVVSLQIYYGKKGEEILIETLKLNQPKDQGFVFDKSKVVPCPEKCTFNWQQFHKDLDVAMAHMIEEFDGFYPSKAKLWDLVEYSFVKSGGNNNSMKSVGEVIASPQYQKRMEERKIDTTHRVGEHEPKPGELLNVEKCSNPNCLICYGPKI